MLLILQGSGLSSHSKEWPGLNVNHSTAGKPCCRRLTFISKKYRVWLKSHRTKTVHMSMCKPVDFPPENWFATFLSFKSTFFNGNFSLGRYDKIQITFGGKILRSFKWFFCNLTEPPRKIELKLTTAKHIAHSNKASLSASLQLGAHQAQRGWVQPVLVFKRRSKVFATD